MKKKFLIMIAVITAVISCLWFFLKPAAKDPTLVTLYGNVDIRQFDIGFQVPGQITKMYFEEGDTIREGSLVAEIDAADYKLQEAKSESEVAKSYAAMVQAQSVYDKYTVLYGTGAISKLDFETVENALKEARSAYNASVTAKDLLARQSDYSKLYALEEGIVTARLVEPGTIIQKGTAVYTLPSRARSGSEPISMKQIWAIFTMVCRHRSLPTVLIRRQAPGKRIRVISVIFPLSANLRPKAYRQPICVQI